MFREEDKMQCLLEHIHLNVHSIEATEKFLSVAMPQFERRGGDSDSSYGAWVHLGNEDCYIALTELPGTKIPGSMRHIGLVTSKLDDMVKRLDEAGYQPADSSELETHPYRRRIYYIDDNGLSWEFVEYLTADASQRNDYS